MTTIKPTVERIASIVPGHSHYHDYIWDILRGVTFYDDYTPIGWLLGCGCHATSYALDDEPGAELEPDMQFGVEVTFGGTIPVLAVRLRELLSEYGICEATY